MPMLSRSIVTAFSGLSAIGVLTGCAAAGAPAGEIEASAPEAPPAEPPAPADGDEASPYADGSYTADGSYVAPSGPESVTVTVTLEDGAVTGVEVVGHAVDRQAQQHQSDFAGGVAAVVVGQPIDGLSVDRVAGSSLTGQGFNAALDEIRAQAAA